MPTGTTCTCKINERPDKPNFSTYATNLPIVICYLYTT